MKITGHKVEILNIPEDDPLGGILKEPIRIRPIVTLRVRTDAGIEGIAVTLYGEVLTGSLKVAVEALCTLICGEDPLRIEKITAKLWSGIGDSCGPGGIFMLALSAIDIALWDIKGKELGLPLWQLLGGHRQRVATYASGALRRGLTDDQIQHAAANLVAKGFAEMKTQLALPGNPAPQDEIRRVQLIRDAIGPDTKLMCDINQRWRPEQAIDLGNRLEDVGLFWLEERNHQRRLSRPCPRDRGPEGTNRRRRISMGRHSVPADDLTPLGRHSNGRHSAGRRGLTMDEGCRHSRGLQFANREPCHARNLSSLGLRMPERAYSRIHALDATTIPGHSSNRGWRVGTS